MDTKLYVGNLSYSTTEEELRTLFAQAGTVNAVELIKDRMTGTSKGFAFVKMGSQADAENAIRMFNGYTFGKREIKVSIARPREETGRGDFGGGPRRSGGGGGGGGGYNRGQGDRGGGDRRGGSGGQNRY